MQGLAGAGGTPPTCCQKVLDQRCERKCILCWYSHGGGYMNLSGLLLSRAFLMWLRPTPLAPGKRERWTLELGSQQPGGRCWGPSTALGLTKSADLGLSPAQDVPSGLACGVFQPWQRLFVPWGCSSPAPAGDRTAACRATSLDGLAHAHGIHHQVLSPHRVGVLALMQLQSCF